MSCSFIPVILGAELSLSQLSKKPVPPQFVWPIPNSITGAVYMQKSGRPRLEDTPGFKEAFATILPYLLAKEISQGEAARELGISVRSLKRYVEDAGALPV